MPRPRADWDDYDEDRPLLPDLEVEDAPPETVSPILDQHGRRIVKRRPMIEWFGFVPLEEK